MYRGYDCSVAYQERHRAQGLCMRCPKPAAINAKGKRLVYCERHRKQDGAKALARYYRLKAGRKGDSR